MRDSRLKTEKGQSRVQNLRVASTQMRCKTMRLDEITEDTSAELNFKNMLGRQFTSKHIFRFVVETQGWVLAPTGSAGQRREVGTNPKCASGVRCTCARWAWEGPSVSSLSATLQRPTVWESVRKSSKGLYPLAQQFLLLKCTQRKQLGTVQKDHSKRHSPYYHLYLKNDDSV